MKTAHLKGLLDTRREVHKTTDIGGAASVPHAQNAISSGLPYIKWGSSGEKMRAMQSLNWRFKNYSSMERGESRDMLSNLMLKSKDYDEANDKFPGNQTALCQP